MQASRTTDRAFFAIKGVFTTHSVVFMGLMVALATVLSFFTINLSPTFRLFTLEFLPAVLVSAVYGPWAGIAFGFVADTVGYLIKPMGPYFPGYAISAMVTGFLYALLLYGRPLRLWRVLVARVLITVIVTFGLNFLWNCLLYGPDAGAFFTSLRLVSNAVKLPVYVLAIYLVLRTTQRIRFFRR